MRVLIAVAAFSLGVSPLRGQQAVATSDVKVRSGQSRTSEIVDTLRAGDTVDLLSPAKRKGYYHVQERDGTQGWVYGRYLSVVSAGTPEPNPNPKPASGDTTVASQVDSTWPKPAPQSSTFHRARFPDCGPAGQDADTQTNLRKNRIDEPAEYHAVSFDAISRLPYPRNHKRDRSKWTPAELRIIEPYEGAAVTVTAFIAQQRGVIVEDSVSSSSGESTNCHAKDDEGVDWHVTLVKHPTDPKSTGIVVETTPRIRAHGHPWTPDMLKSAMTNADSVRLSGWLLYDPEHYAQTANYDSTHAATNAVLVRATLWEVHPVTRMEVFNPQTGQWRQLP